MTSVASRGPIPKRSDVRRRRNAEGKAVDKAKVKPVSAAAKAADPTWPKLVKDLWLSLNDSGMADFYTASDWAYARVAMTFLAQALEEDRPNAALITSVMNALSPLGLTEGDRRRMRIEVERQPKELPPEVTIMDKYRKVLNAESS